MSGWKRFCLAGVVVFSICAAEAAPRETSADRRKAREQEREAKKRQRQAEKEQKEAERERGRATPAKDAKTIRKYVITKDADKRRPEGNLPCVEKEFTISTGIETEPQVKLTCIVPVDGAGQPTEGARDVVFYSPYAGARNALAKRPELRRYANALGMTIFTIEITTDTKYLNDSEKYYCFPVSGWHEVAVNAWKKVLEEFKLEKRKLLIMGDSVGGSYAQQIAARYPDEIDAVAFTGGRLFGEVRKNDISWLILSIWECPGMENSRNLANEYRALGVNVLQSEGPPIYPGNPAQHLYHHAPSNITFELMEDFLAGIRDLRKQHGGKVPPVAEWPVHETMFGETRVFPSTQTADSWKKLPLGVRREIELRDMLPIVLEPPEITADTGIVIYSHDPELRNTILEDNMCFFASQGFICTALRPGAGTAEYRKLAVYAASHFPNREIYVVGTGFSGARLAVGVLSSGVNVQEVTLLNTEYEDLLASLEEERIPMRSRDNITVFMDSQVAETPKNRYGIEVKSFNRKPEFGNEWFNALAMGLADDD